MDKKVGLLEKTITEVGITDDNIIEIVSQLAGVDIKNKSDVEDLLLRCEDNDYIIDLTFDELNHLPFGIAKKVIFNFSMVKRLQMLDVVKIKREYLDKMISYYGMENPPIRVMPSEFSTMMSKLKHMEILLGWLYGIE